MINERPDRIGTSRFLSAVLLVVAFVATHYSNAAVANDWALPPQGPIDFSALPDRPVLSAVEPFDYGKALETALSRIRHFEEVELRLEDIALSAMLDPEAVFTYVRDEIRTEPYQGHLRRPEAVIAAGGGNDHDKARTLAALLRSMGYDTRLVQAPMTSDMAEAIQFAACEKVGKSDDQVWRLAALQGATMERVKARAERSFNALRDAMAGTSLPDLSQKDSKQNHIWVQARIDQDWVDLDPTLTDAKFGTKPATVGEILTDAIASHTVSISLELETLTNGKLRHKTILTQRLPVPETTEQPISLFFGPATDGVGSELTNALGGVIGKTPSMRAIMTVAGKSFKSSPFTTPGRPENTTDFFKEKQTEINTAITLHIKSEVPGQTASEEKRIIFDLLNTQQRLAAAEGDAPDFETIAEPQIGKRYPAELESMRQIVLGNGGLSRRLAALRMSGVLLELPETMQQLSVGEPDPEALIWYSWIAASTIALASEELMRAHPINEGICILADRPRLLVSGVQILPQGGMVNWIDWTLDDIGIAGDTSGSKAAITARQMRMWHGALQSGLETEAILTQNAAPNGAIPPEEGEIVPLVGADLAKRGSEAGSDLDRGFKLFASQDMSDDSWWRVDPQTGRSDARFTFAGNARPFFPKPGDGAIRSGIADAGRTASEMASDPNGFKQRLQRDLREQLRREAEAKRKADALRKKSKGGNEYTIVLGNVSITISTYAGAAIGTTIMLAVAYALFG